jgi:hypothetical protein
LKFVLFRFNRIVHIDEHVFDHLTHLEGLVFAQYDCDELQKFEDLSELLGNVHSRKCYNETIAENFETNKIDYCSKIEELNQRRTFQHKLPT